MCFAISSSNNFSGVQLLGLLLLTCNANLSPTHYHPTNLYLQIRLLIEGLFAHFFSSHRPAYHKEDVEWFLELANQQEDWCPNTVQVVTAAQKSITEKERTQTASLDVEVCMY